MKSNSVVCWLLICFCFFSLPGGGKTMTIVETILQLLRRPRSSSNSHSSPTRLLVVTPSNTAADVIVERLSHEITQPNEMARINAYQRHTGVRPKVQKYVYYDPLQTGHYGLPDIATLMSYPVVVMTVAMSGHLVDLNLPVGHFSHILFDESCQALEPETFIPLCLAGPSTAVILAGDHQQLGADVHSGIASGLGLKVSLQERLLHFDLYQQSLAQPLHAVPCTTVRLTKNYRSHPSLLAISSALFYEGTLQAYAERDVVNSLTRWNGLPNQKNFPLLFYGVIGQDIFEQEYSSFSNPIEAMQVVKLIQQLLASEVQPKVTTNDIGVIGQLKRVDKGKEK